MATEIFGNLAYLDDGTVMPVSEWQQYQDWKLRQERPEMLLPRETSVAEDVGNWLGDKMQRVTGLDRRAVQPLANRTADLLGWVPGPGTAISAAQAKRDYGAGRTGAALLGGVGSAAEAIGLGTMARGALGGTTNLLGDVISEARNARAIGAMQPGARLTSEAIPYADLGAGAGFRHVGIDPAAHLPGAARLSEAEKDAFTAARNWADPATGEDIFLRAIGAPQQAAMRGQGVYTPPSGVTEYNPLTTRITGATDEQLQATEALRGLLDVQGASTWTRPNAGSQPALVIPHSPGEGSKEMIAKLTDAGSAHGIPTVYDIGDHYVMTNFGGTMPDLSPELRRAVGRATGTKPISTTIATGYPSYEDAWRTGAPDAARQLIEYLTEADPAAVQALGASGDIRSAAAARAMLDTQAEKALGGGNMGVGELRRMIGRDQNWLTNLPEYAARYKAREIPVQPPTALRQTPDMLAAQHQGPAGLLELDPAKAGSNPGIVGAERGLPAPAPKQVYMGVDVGKPGGYVPEYGLQTGETYRMDLPRAQYADVAQFDVSPGGGVPSITAEANTIVGRIAATRKSPMTETERDRLITSYQMAIAKARGYSGLLNTGHEQGSMATSFYPIRTR